MSLSGASEALVRRWLDRPENRAEWERLRGALSLAEGFQFFALQVNDPIAELFLEMLLKAEAEDHGAGLAGFDLARPPDEGPAVTVLLRAMEAAPRPAWFFFQGGSKVREGLPALGDLFLYLNQKRDIVAQTAGAPFLLSLPPEGWALFRQAAPDFWSIHTSVYRFTGAEVRREERVREASEEAFLWQTFASFVAVRFLRAVLPSRLPRRQVGIVPFPLIGGLIGREAERRTLRTWLTQPGARILVPEFAGTRNASLLGGAVADARSSFPGGVFYFSLRRGGGAVRVMEDVVDALRPGLVVPLLRRKVLRAMFRDVTAENKVLLVLDDIEDASALSELAPSPPSAVLAAGRADPPPEGWRRLTLRAPRLLAPPPPKERPSEEGAGIRLEVVSQAAQERGDLALAAETLGWAALSYLRDGHLDGARERLVEARALAQKSGRLDLEALILRHQAAFWLWTGHVDAVTGLVGEVVRLNPTGWVRGDLSVLSVLSLALGGKIGEGQVERLIELADGARSSVSPALRLLVGCAALGRFTEALDKVQSDLDVALDPAFTLEGDLGVLARAWTLRAELHLRQGDRDVARNEVRLALRRARAIYDWEAEAEALRVMGEIQEEEADFAGAATSYQHLLERRKQLYATDHEGVAWAALDLAEPLRLLGRFEEAEELHLLAMAIFQGGRPRTDRALAAALHEYGGLLLRLNRLIEAETILREALALSLDSAGPADLHSLRIMGTLGLALEDKDEAEEFLRSSLAIQEHSGASQSPGGRRVLAGTLFILGMTHAERGEVEDAVRILRDRVLPIYEELGDQIRRADILGHIGNLLAGQKRYNEALPFLREELAIRERLGDVEAAERIRTTLEIFTPGRS